VKVYTVFHFDAIRRVREPVGIVLERRKQDRGNNFEGIMKVARKVYPPPSPETLVTLE
jgi:hypothetical protein